MISRASPSAVCRMTASYSHAVPLKTSRGSPARIRRTVLRYLRLFRRCGADVARLDGVREVDPGDASLAAALFLQDVADPLLFGDEAVEREGIAEEMGLDVRFVLFDDPRDDEIAAGADEADEMGTELDQDLRRQVCHDQVEGLRERGDVPVGDRRRGLRPG